MGEHQQLSQLKLYYQKTYRACNNIDLAVSNTIECAHCFSNSEISCARLDKINGIYSRSNLLSIALLDPTKLVSLDNIHGSSAGAIVESKLKVSIIMPAYNAALYIHTAIRSILSQTFKNIELIVVDDGSTDNTFSILEELRSSDKRIKLFRHQYSLGAYAARNTALLNSTGFYITNHDSDDWSHPQRLELMVNSLEQNPGSMVALADWVRATPALIFGISKIHHGLIEPSVSTLIIRRATLIEIGGWDQVRVAADSELLDRIKTVYGSHTVLNVCPQVPLVIARSIENSLTTSAATHWKSDFYGMRKHYRTLYSAFHKKISHSQETFTLTGKHRMFPAPAANLMTTNNFEFDFVLIADFSRSCNLELKTELIHTFLCKGQFIGICHWPDYNGHGDADVANHFISLELDYCLKVLTCDIHCSAKNLVVLEPSLLSKPMDFIPKVKFQRCMVKSPSELISFLNYSFMQDDSELIISSGEFWPDWYLLNNQDVRSQGADPLQHFIMHGLQENRLPNPNFNSNDYIKRVPRLLDFQWPPFAHYLKIGRAHNIPGDVNEFLGNLATDAERPTILIAAHAAGKLLFGAERCLLDLIASLNNLAFNVIVTTPQSDNDSYLEKLKTLSTKIYIVPCAPWKGSSSPDKWAIDRFCQIIENNNIDIVLANTLTQREPLLAAKHKAKDTILYAHESPQHDLELCNQIALDADKIIEELENIADAIWVTSKYSSSSFKRNRRLYIVGNVVDFDKFDIPNDIDRNSIKFSVISSNTPKKGILDVIQIASLMGTSTPNAHFLIIGPDNDFILGLKKLQRIGEIGENVQFVDYLEESLDAIKLTNVVLSLSHCQETFARTVLEGMAARRPVVAYNWGALPELIDHANNGYLVPPLDINIATNFIKELACNPEKILSYGECARAHAISNHSSESMQLQIKGALSSFTDITSKAPSKRSISSQSIKKTSTLKSSGKKKKR